MYLGNLGRYLSLNSYIHWFLCAYVSLNMYIDILPIYYYSFLNTFQSLFIILSYLHCYVCLIYICFLPGAMLFNWSVIFILNVKVDSIIMDSVDKPRSLRRVIFESLYSVVTAPQTFVEKNRYIHQIWTWNFSVHYMQGARNNKQTQLW